MKSKNRIKVGIVGENIKNDSEALQTLLKSVAAEDVEFTVYPKRFDGGQLDGDKFFRTLEAESLFLDWIILVRDLDGLISDTKKLEIKDLWFNKANKRANNKGIFFLAIYEMEALILSDIQKLNEYYDLKLKPVGDPMNKKDPKEYLMKETAKTQKGKYEPKHAPKIFQILDFKTIYKNHKGERSFQAFADELKNKKLVYF